MNIEKRRSMLIAIIILALAIFSTAVLAANGIVDVGAITGSDKAKVDALLKPYTEGQFKSELSKQFGKKNDELDKLKAEKGSWGKASYTLISEKYKQVLTDEKINTLYKQGYYLDDISTAGVLAAISGKTPEEILSIKGKDGRYTVVTTYDKEGNPKDEITDHNPELWEKAVATLGIDIKQTAKLLGVSPDRVQQMEADKMTKLQIFDTAMMMQGYDADSNEISSEFRKGTPRQTIIKKYEERWSKNHPQTLKPQLDEATRKDEALKNLYKITGDEIKMFNQNGIEKINEMADAKSIAAKYKKTLDTVVALKKTKSTWKNVEATLRGDKQ